MYMTNSSLYKKILYSIDEILKQMFNGSCMIQPRLEFKLNFHEIKIWYIRHISSKTKIKSFLKI